MAARHNLNIFNFEKAPIPIKEANLLELETDDFSEPGVANFPKKTGSFQRNTMNNAKWKKSFNLEDTLAINSVATQAKDDRKSDQSSVYCAIP